MKRLFIIALSVVAFTVLSTSCQKEIPDGEAAIKAISFEKSNNPSLASTVTGKVDEAAKTITFVVPASAGTTNFVATFTVTKDDVVSINGNTVESGVTSCNFSGATIVVSDAISNLKTDYTVKIQSTDEKAELISFVFAKADNSALEEDVVSGEIAPEMIVRVPAAAFQTELKIKVTAGQDDIITIDDQPSADGSAVVDTKFPIDITVTDAIAGVSNSYVVKVGKILDVLVTHLGTFTEGTIGTNDADMAINPSDNTPYIVYLRKLEGESNNSAAVVKWNGTGFEKVGDVASGNAKAASRPAIAFDNNNTPYVKYVGGEVASRNFVRKFNGASWDVVGGDAVMSGGITSVNVNTSYYYPVFFTKGNNNPRVFFNGNSKNTPSYRNGNIASFNGSEWSEALWSNAPAYGSGSTASSGSFYGAQIASLNGKTFVLGSFNEFGFYVFEAGDNSFTTIVENYVPAGETCALFGNAGIAVAPDGTPYIFEALWKAGKMQIFKVNASSKDVTEYGESIPVNIGSSGSVSDKAAFGINPKSGQFVAVVDNEEGIPSFKYLDDSSQWDTFSIDFAEKAKTDYRIKFTPNGCGYVSFISANGIELFSIDYEDDILPE